MFRNATPAGHRSLLAAIVSLATGARSHRKNGGISAPVLTTSRAQKDDGKARIPAPSLNLEAMALMRYNRDRKAAAAFVRVHTILGAGRADH